ncbi:hypothetical protein CAI21_05800 [Alkalilimnicola ehrlichii]|nr:hypothetical protein [Alkalilimnicola ehrlichii]RFA30557.1 hypothetical protein CAI21_05800 [Alkalilimnicola ehrlichii]
MPGALYDLTELLQPGLPFIETLLELYRGSLPQTGFVPQIVAIGSETEQFPVQALAPLRRPGSGPLLAIPLLFVGQASAIDKLQEQLESVLLEKGQAQLETENCLRQDWGLQPVNLSYVTVNDLCALLKIQLENAELGKLWQLLESALYRPNERTRVELDTGNIFFLEGNQAYSPYYTFDEWQALHPNLSDPTAGYSEWTKQQRTYFAGLGAHGIEVHPVAGTPSLAGLCENKGLDKAKRQALSNPGLLREPDHDPDNLEDASIILLTEHALNELGPVAYTALVQAADGTVLHLGNEYPLQPSGIAMIRDYWGAKRSA